MASNKIVIFLTGSLEAGGLERFVTRVSIQAKNDHKFIPVVICLRKKAGIFLNELLKNDIEVLQAPGGWQRRPGGLIQLGRQIRDQNPVAVHSQVNFSLLQQMLAVRLFSSAQFLVTERNCYPLRGFARVRRVVQFYILKLFGTHYSGNSINVVNYVASMLWYPARKIPVIPNGMEIPQTSESVRRNIRDLYGWKDDDFVIGYVSRFATHKGHSYFLKVMHHLWQTLGTRLKICFVGDGPLRVTIESENNKSVLAGQTVFTGVINNVQDYYQSFDCLALLSEFEGMPNVVMEAMGFGVPVVANPVGNVRELFDGGGGILNDSNEPEKTADLFLQLSENPYKRKQIGTLAKEKINHSFSLKHTLELLEGYYGI